MIKKVYTWLLFIMQLKIYLLRNAQMQFVLYGSYLRFSECVTIMDNTEYLVKVCNDEICIKMLNMLFITCIFVLDDIQKL